MSVCDECSCVCVAFQSAFFHVSGILRLSHRQGSIRMFDVGIKILMPGHQI